MARSKLLPQIRSQLSAAQLDQLCINTIRFLAVDGVQKANSGHPGMPMGAAPMAYVLWTRFLRHDPAKPAWPNRDRFVLSAGHGSMLLYGLLHLTGYDMPLEEFKQFQAVGKQDSRTSGTLAGPGNRNHDGTAGPGDWQRRGHGNRAKASGRALQSPRP